MKTKENNRLIAEFMGIDQVDIDYHEDSNGELKYHTSWDWLMPVVEKIESLEDENKCKLYNFQSEQCFVTIVVNHTGEDIVEVDADNRLDATYQAVISFIKFYNKP
jgi:hypothetical protein